MTNLEGELDQIVLESGTFAKKIEDAVIAEDLSAYEKNAKEVGKAGSGSWLGYHSRVYHCDFHPPPAGVRFDPRYPLPRPNHKSDSATTGRWVEYTNDEIWAKLKTLSDEKINDLNKLANNAVDEMEECRERLLSILNAANQGKGDKYLQRLIEETDKIKAITVDQFIYDFAPTGQKITHDEAAVSEGTITPLHFMVLSHVKAIRSPFTAAGKIAKLAGRCKSHLSHLSATSALLSSSGRNVFIGHGGSNAWRDLKDFIQDRLKLPFDEFNRVPVGGITNVARLSQMLDDATIAFLVMTAEDEQSDGTKHARMNVIHEAGLFQGRIGFTRAIVLLEEGCEEFSNIEGLGQIRFPKGNISAKFEDIRHILEREGVIEQSIVTQ